MRRLLHEAEARAIAVVDGNRPAIGRLIEALEDRETLDREAVIAILGVSAGSKGAGGGLRSAAE